MAITNKNLIVKWEYIDLEYDENIANDGEYLDNEITIKDGIDIWDLRETIIHELIHCILHKYYYTRTSNPIIKPKIEEQLVNILASELDKNIDTIAYQISKYKRDKKLKWESL